MTALEIVAELVVLAMAVVGLVCLCGWLSEDGDARWRGRGRRR